MANNLPHRSRIQESIEREPVYPGQKFLHEILELTENEFKRYQEGWKRKNWNTLATKEKNELRVECDKEKDAWEKIKHELRHDKCRKHSSSGIDVSFLSAISSKTSTISAAPNDLQRQESVAKQFESLDGTQRKIFFSDGSNEAKFFRHALSCLEGARCEVCDQPESPLHACTSCGAVFHFTCYAPKNICTVRNSRDQNLLICELCQYKNVEMKKDDRKIMPRCFLCPKTDGLLCKVVVNFPDGRRWESEKDNCNQLWCHPMCGMWNPSCYYKNEERTVIDCSGVMLDDGRTPIGSGQPCGLCGATGGVKSQCNECQKNNKTASVGKNKYYHISCARQAGMELTFLEQDKKKIGKHLQQFVLKCHKHSSHSYSLVSRLQQLLKIEGSRLLEAPMSFGHAARLLHTSISILSTLGWASRWESKDPTLSALGRDLRERVYDDRNNSKKRSWKNLDLAIKSAVQLIPSFMIQPYQVELIVDWLGRAYRSRSKLLGFGSDAIPFRDCNEMSNDKNMLPSQQNGNEISFPSFCTRNDNNLQDNTKQNPTKLTLSSTESQDSHNITSSINERMPLNFVNNSRVRPNGKDHSSSRTMSSNAADKNRPLSFDRTAAPHQDGLQIKEKKGISPSQMNRKESVLFERINKESIFESLMDTAQLKEDDLLLSSCNKMNEKQTTSDTRTKTICAESKKSRNIKKKSFNTSKSKRLARSLLRMQDDSSSGTISEESDSDSMELRNVLCMEKKASASKKTNINPSERNNRSKCSENSNEHQFATSELQCSDNQTNKWAEGSEMLQGSPKNSKTYDNKDKNDGCKNQNVNIDSSVIGSNHQCTTLDLQTLSKKSNISLKESEVLTNMQNEDTRIHHKNNDSTFILRDMPKAVKSAANLLCEIRKERAENDNSAKKSENLLDSRKNATSGENDNAAEFSTVSIDQISNKLPSERTIECEISTYSSRSEKKDLFPDFTNSGNALFEQLLERLEILKPLMTKKVEHILSLDKATIEKEMLMAAHGENVKAASIDFCRGAICGWLAMTISYFDKSANKRDTFISKMDSSIVPILEKKNILDYETFSKQSLSTLMDIYNEWNMSRFGEKVDDPRVLSLLVLKWKQSISRQQSNKLRSKSQCLKETSSDELMSKLIERWKTVMQTHLKNIDNNTAQGIIQCSKITSPLHGENNLGTNVLSTKRTNGLSETLNASEHSTNSHNISTLSSLALMERKGNAYMENNDVGDSELHSKRRKLNNEVATTKLNNTTCSSKASSSVVALEKSLNKAHSSKNLVSIGESQQEQSPKRSFITSANEQQIDHFNQHSTSFKKFDLGNNIPGTKKKDNLNNCCSSSAFVCVEWPKISHNGVTAKKDYHDNKALSTPDVSKVINGVACTKTSIGNDFYRYSNKGNHSSTSNQLRKEACARQKSDIVAKHSENALVPYVKITKDTPSNESLSSSTLQNEAVHLASLNETPCDLTLSRQKNTYAAKNNELVRNASKDFGDQSHKFCKESIRKEISHSKSIGRRYYDENSTQFFRTNSMEIESILELNLQDLKKDVFFEPNEGTLVDKKYDSNENGFFLVGNASKMLTLENNLLEPSEKKMDKEDGVAFGYESNCNEIRQFEHVATDNEDKLININDAIGVFHQDKSNTEPAENVNPSAILNNQTQKIQKAVGNNRNGKAAAEYDITSTLVQNEVLKDGRLIFICNNKSLTNRDGDHVMIEESDEMKNTTELKRACKEQYKSMVPTQNDFICDQSYNYATSLQMEQPKFPQNIRCQMLMPHLAETQYSNQSPIASNPESLAFMKHHDKYGMLAQEQMRYEMFFLQHDKQKDGYISMDHAESIFSQSGLSMENFRKIWRLVDDPMDYRLNKIEFAIALHLIVCIIRKGMKLPESLPASLRLIKQTVKKESKDHQVKDFIAEEIGDEVKGRSSDGRAKSKMVPLRSKCMISDGLNKMLGSEDTERFSDRGESRIVNDHPNVEIVLANVDVNNYNNNLDTGARVIEDTDNAVEKCKDEEVEVIEIEDEDEDENEDFTSHEEMKEVRKASRLENTDRNIKRKKQELTSLNDYLIDEVVDPFVINQLKKNQDMDQLPTRNGVKAITFTRSTQQKNTIHHKIKNSNKHFADMDKGKKITSEYDEQRNKKVLAEAESINCSDSDFPCDSKIPENDVGCSDSRNDYEQRNINLILEAIAAGITSEEKQSNGFNNVIESSKTMVENDLNRKRNDIDDWERTSCLFDGTMDVNVDKRKIVANLSRGNEVTESMNQKSIQSDCVVNSNQMAQGKTHFKLISGNTELIYIKEECKECKVLKLVTERKYNKKNEDGKSKCKNIFKTRNVKLHRTDHVQNIKKNSFISKTPKKKAEGSIDDKVKDIKYRSTYKNEKFFDI